MVPVYFTRKQGHGVWGGVGMMTFMDLHTCEMLRNCWTGVGMMAFMHLHTCEMLRNCWAGVGMMAFMHLHTCEMLRNRWAGVMGWWGRDDGIQELAHM